MISKKVFSSFFVFFLVIHSLALGNFWKFYGSGRLNDCIVATDSTVVSVGSDFFVMKTNFQGDTLWTRNFPGTGGLNGLNEAFSVTETPDHFYLVCGHSGPTSAILRLIKIDSNGELIWNKYYGPGAGTCVKVNHQGLYVMTFVSDPGINSHVFVSEVDTAGNLIWQTSINLNFDDRTWGLDFDQSDNVFVVGKTALFSGDIFGFIIKLSNNGTPLDTTIFSSATSTNELYDILVVNDSEIYACGDFEYSITNYGTWVLKINNRTDSVFTRVLPFHVSAWNIFYQSSHSRFIVSGYGYEPGQTDQNVYVLWLDSSLLATNSFKIDSTSFDNSFGFALSQNQIFVAGYSDFPNQTEYRWVYLIDTTFTSEIKFTYSIDPIFTYCSGEFLHFTFGTQGGNIFLYNLNGQLMNSIRIEESSGVIDLSEISTGIYIAVLIDSRRKIEKYMKFVIS